MEELKISVVTVCFNAKLTIERTIESVLAQKHANFEYIIIDGNSIDGTKEILSKYSDRITKIISERDKGIYDAMNKGWKIATGHFVHFLNADDWYCNDKVLSSFTRSYRSNNDLTDNQKMSSIWHGKVVFKRRDGYEDVHGSPLKPGAMRFTVEDIFQPATFFPRDAFEKYGGFDLRYKIGSDYDLIKRFAKNLNSHFLDFPITYMSDGGLSSTKILESMHEHFCISIRTEVNFIAPTIYWLPKILRIYLREKMPRTYRLGKSFYNFLISCRSK